MKTKMRAPRFQLQKVYADGSREEPQLLALDGIDTACRMGRRGFLLTSAVGAGALAVLSGCVPQLGGTVRSSEKGLTTVFAPDAGAKARSVKGAVAHYGLVNTLAFSPDGKTLASGGDDKTVKLWAVPEAKLTRTVAMPALVNALVFTPDGKTLLAGLSDRNIHSLPRPFAKAGVLTQAGGSVMHLSLSADGKTLIVMTAGGIEIRSLPGGGLVREIPGPVYCVVLSPDGTTLAGGGFRKTKTALYATSSGALIKEWEIPTQSAAFSPDGKTLATRNHYALRLWDMPSAAQRKGLEILTGSGRTSVYPKSPPLAFSPDGAWLATAAGGREGGLVLLPKPYETLAFYFQEDTALARVLTFSPDGRFLAAGLIDGSVIIWEMPGGGGEPVFRAALFDPAATKQNVSVMQATTTESSTYIGPCGGPLPPGAVCTCNCVPGKYTAPVTTCTCNTVRTGTYCSCNRICTCVPVK